MKNIILTAVIVILVATSSILGYLYADTSNELDSTKLQLNSANSQVTSLQNEVATANSQVTSLQTQLSSANAEIISVQTQLADVQGQLDSIQSIYPLKPFSDVDALQDWVDSNIELIQATVDANTNSQMWKTMMAVHNKAEAEGWIVNACCDGQHFSLQALVGTNDLYIISTITAGLIIEIDL